MDTLKKPAFRWLSFFYIIPIQVFIFIYWFKSGIIDKLINIPAAAMFDWAYQGNSWQGWHDYIAGNWDKSFIGKTFFSPVFAVAFPIIIFLQCLPAVLAAISIIKGEFRAQMARPWLVRAALANLFVIGVMNVSQNMTGGSDGEYLWHYLGFSMIVLMYIRVVSNIEKD